MENIKELLDKRELAMVKGGKMTANTMQLAAFELGNSSCCNIKIIIKKPNEKQI